MANFLDAVFAFFGDDEPTGQLRAVMFDRIEPTDEELEEILSSNDGSENGKAYCQRVHDWLLYFCADRANYVAGLADDDPRKCGLAEIAEAHKAGAAVLPAIVEPEPVSESEAIAKVDPMLSGTVRVAQPPRTTPIRTSAPVVENPADDHPSHDEDREQPASQPQGDTMSRGNDTRRERGDGQQRDGRQDDGQRVHRTLTPEKLIKFFDDPDAYIAKITEDAAEKSGLTGLIAAIKAKKIAALGNPITREMRECAKSKRWKGIYNALLDAYLRQDADRISIASQLRDSYLNGVFDAKGRIIGALMRQCIKDIEGGFNTSHPKEFKRRYVG